MGCYAKTNLMLFPFPQRLSSQSLFIWSYITERKKERKWNSSIHLEVIVHTWTCLDVHTQRITTSPSHEKGYLPRWVRIERVFADFLAKGAVRPRTYISPKITSPRRASEIYSYNSLPRIYNQRTEMKARPRSALQSLARTRVCAYARSFCLFLAFMASLFQFWIETNRELRLLLYNLLSSLWWRVFLCFLGGFTFLPSLAFSFLAYSLVLCFYGFIFVAVGALPPSFLLARHQEANLVFFRRVSFNFASSPFLCFSGM